MAPSLNISSQPLSMRGVFWVQEHTQLWGSRQESAKPEGGARSCRRAAGRGQWAVVHIKTGYVSLRREKPVISKLKEPEQGAVLFISVRMKAENTTSLSKTVLTENIMSAFLLEPHKCSVFWNGPDSVSFIVYKRGNHYMDMETWQYAYKST